MAVTEDEIFSEKAMSPHSRTLAWKIPWMEEPGGYSPWGCYHKYRKLNALGPMLCNRRSPRNTEPAPCN